ncbi:MAG: RNase adapter RapZ [Thermodesulfobacteriota bacterium]|nr:RNase adapter RapZ [Thermodesulfobacteriota bacterium]
MNKKPLVTIHSFGFHYTQTIQDPFGHGGYVFDCRQLPNPGRQKEFEKYSGFDQPVVEYFENHPEVHRFYNLTFELVKSHCENFTARGFENLFVSFGCTGGQHRSVYMAERLRNDLAMKGFDTQCIHKERFRWDEAFSHICRKAFILAAGLGTRLLPMTKHLPKALVKIGREPAINLVSKKLIRAGVREIIVNTHHLSEQVETHLEALRLDCRFKTIYEPELLDTGGSLKNTDGLWGDEPFFIHNVDIVSETNLELLYRYHLASRALVTVVVQERNSASYFVVDSDNRVCGLYESKKGLMDIRWHPKGPIRHLAFSGIHVVSPNIFNEIKEIGRFSIINLYLRLIGEGFLISAYIDKDGFFADIGKHEGLQKANEWLQH